MGGSRYGVMLIFLFGFQNVRTCSTSQHLLIFKIKTLTFNWHTTSQLKYLPPQLKTQSRSGYQSIPLQLFMRKFGICSMFFFLATQPQAPRFYIFLNIWYFHIQNCAQIHIQWNFSCVLSFTFRVILYQPEFSVRSSTFLKSS